MTNEPVAKRPYGPTHPLVIRNGPFVRPLRVRAPKYALDLKVANFALALVRDSGLSNRKAVIVAMHRFPPCKSEQSSRVTKDSEDSYEARLRRIVERLKALLA